MTETANKLDFKHIKGLAFDVDGVFTDGGILCDLSGELYRTFDAKDGFAVRMLSLKNIPVAIITGGRSGSIRERFKSCGVPPENVYLGSRDKLEDLEKFCSRFSLELDEVLYAGDDIPDIEAIVKCGTGCCPSDAVPEVKEAADYISPFPGGRGCVRDIIENVLKANRLWEFDAKGYKARF